MSDATLTGVPVGSAKSGLLANRWTFPLALAVLPVFFFYRLTFLGEVLYWGTPLLQFYPWRAFAVSEYLSGRVPLWNPYVGLGAPLAANLQSAVFYPMNAFYLVVPIERAMTLSVLLHVSLAGVFMYAFSRRLGVSNTGAFVSGLCFMFSGFVIARAGFLSMTSVVAWLPALFLCIEGLRQSTGNRSRSLLWFAALASVTGMMLLAGHVQMAYYSLLAAGCYLLVRSRGNLLRGTAIGVLAMVLGAALAAVQLLPTFELARLSERADGVPYDIATSFSLWPGQLLGIVFPTILGTQAAGDWLGPGPFWEGVIYVGVLPLLLAFYGARFAPRRRAIFFGGLALVSIFLAFGRYNPLFRPFFDFFPGIGSFQGPARFGLWFTFGAAVLAGYGWDAVVARRFGGWHAGRVAAVVGVGALLAAVGAAFALGDNPAPRGAAMGGVLLVAGGVLLCVGRRDVRWRMAAVALVVADLFAFGSTLNPSTSTSLYSAPPSVEVTALKKQTGLSRIYTPESTYQSLLARDFGFRNFGSSDGKHLLQVRDAAMPDLSTIHGLYEVYNYDPLRVQRPLLVMRASEKQGDRSPLLGMLGTAYMLKAVPVDSNIDPLVHPEPLPTPLPRAYVVHRVTAVAGKPEALAAISSPPFDPRTEAVVESPTLSAGLGTGSIDATRIVEYSPQRVVIETPTSSTGGLLILSDAFYPGWIAEVDGEATPIFATNVALRGVFVAAGEHRIVFRYDPLSFKLGLAISALATLFIAGMLAWGIHDHRMGTQ